jgi:hypothetical protein
VSDGPDKQDLRQALDQFGQDATRWRDCGDTLGQARARADDLALRAADFGPVRMVHGAYADTQQFVAMLLREGSSECDSVAGNLITARDSYQRDEDANVHKIKGIW